MQSNYKLRCFLIKTSSYDKITISILNFLIWKNVEDDILFVVCIEENKQNVFPKINIFPVNLKINLLIKFGFFFVCSVCVGYKVTAVICFR